jgi:hypothetical protein
MSSQLNVDTIVDKAGSGGTNVKMANTSTYVSDGGSATQNTVQGLVKVWCHFVQDSSHTISDSFNVGSLTDNGEGDTTQNLTNNMSNSNFSGNCNAGLSNNRYALWSTLGTGTMPILSFRRGSSNSTADDASGITTQIAGDLA